MDASLLTTAATTNARRRFPSPLRSEGPLASADPGSTFWRSNVT